MNNENNFGPFAQHCKFDKFENWRDDEKKGIIKRILTPFSFYHVTWLQWLQYKRIKTTAPKRRKYKQKYL